MHNQVVLTTMSLDELTSIIGTTVKNAMSTDKPVDKVIQENNDFVKIEEVCKLFHVSKVTIHSWKKSGKLPFYRISNKVYFKKSEIIEAMNKIERKTWL